MKAVPFDLFASPLGRSTPGVTRENAISVSDLTTETRALIESLQPVRGRGETSNFKHNRNGNWYFCLRDAQARIRCVVWPSDHRRITAARPERREVIMS